MSCSLLSPAELSRGENNKHLRMKAQKDMFFLCVGARVHFGGIKEAGGVANTTPLCSGSWLPPKNMSEITLPDTTLMLSVTSPIHIQSTLETHLLYSKKKKGAASSDRAFS